MANANQRIGEYVLDAEIGRGAFGVGLGVPCLSVLGSTLFF